MNDNYTPLGTIHNGNKRFTLTPASEEALTGILFWKHIEKTGREDTKEDCKAALTRFYSNCKVLKIPKWLISKAEELAENNTGSRAVKVSELYKAFDGKQKNKEIER